MIRGRTFEEKWRIVTLALVAGAGVVATLLLVGLILVVWLGKWSEAVEVLRINMLATTAIGVTTLMGASMVGLLIAGPLAKLSAKFGDNEVSAEGD